MTLYMNEGQHRTLYKSNEKIHDNNQDYYELNQSNIAREAQKKLFDQLERRMQGMRFVIEKHSDHKEAQLNAVMSHMEKTYQHLQQMKDVEKQSHRNHTNFEELQFGLNHVTKLIEEQHDKQTDLQKTITKRVEKHTKHVQKIEERLSNQEAIGEKTSRQLDELRTIIYERTHELTEKIEDSFVQVALFIGKLITGSNHELNHYAYKQSKRMKSLK